MGSRGIEASCLVPSAAQEGVDRVDTYKADYTPTADDQYTEVGRTMPAGVHTVRHKKRMEKQRESCENSPRY